MNEKVSLRRTLLKSRHSLSREAWEKRSQQIANHLLASELVQNSQTILAYFSVRNEPDLSGLFTRSQHSWGFPRCVDKSLFWHCWQPGERLQSGKFGILEPLASGRMLMPEEVDLILIPAIALDKKGYRLGYGGGFYDRMLANPIWQGKLTIGVVFELGYVDELPIDDWDCPLDGVCTEMGLKLL